MNNISMQQSIGYNQNQPCMPCNPCLPCQPSSSNNFNNNQLQ